MKEILLINAKPNETYKISRLDILDKTLLAQLNHLGFCKDGLITKRCSNYGKKSFLVSVIGINYAIDKQVSEKVWVYDK